MIKKQGFDTIYESTKKNIYEKVLSDYKNDLKNFKNDWVISIHTDNINKRIFALSQGYPGQVLATNHFISEMLNSFNDYKNNALEPKISDFLPNIINLQSKFIEDKYNTQYKPDYLLAANENDWVLLCAEYSALNKFIEFIDIKPLSKNNNCISDSNENNDPKNIEQIENDIKERFDPDCWNFYKNNIESELKNKKVGKGNKTFIKSEKNGELKWMARKNDLVALINILEEYGYFKITPIRFKMKVHLKLRRLFEKYYNIKLDQADKPNLRKKIDPGYAKTTFPFIIKASKILYDIKNIKN